METHSGFLRLWLNRSVWIVGTCVLVGSSWAGVARASDGQEERLRAMRARADALRLEAKELLRRADGMRESMKRMQERMRDGRPGEGDRIRELELRWLDSALAQTSTRG